MPADTKQPSAGVPALPALEPAAPLAPAVPLPLAPPFAVPLAPALPLAPLAPALVPAAPPLVVPLAPPLLVPPLPALFAVPLAPALFLPLLPAAPEVPAAPPVVMMTSTSCLSDSAQATIRAPSRKLCLTQCRRLTMFQIVGWARQEVNETWRFEEVVFSKRFSENKRAIREEARKRDDSAATRQASSRDS
jgi:hypothetical protein